MARQRRRVRAKKAQEAKQLTIMAFDLGANCGWATFRNGRISSGTWRLSKPTTKKHTERPGMRFSRFMDELDIMLGLGKPDEVFYEEVHAHVGTDAAHAYGGFRAHLMCWCEKNGFTYGSYGVGTIKKRATGKGNAKKPDMIIAANKTYSPILGRPVTDDNEADALWILALALDKHGISND